ncbi:MAG: glycosyltransferase [Cyanobacteria bacterium]|jgi:glycosyltransferase involved in cell wall biosynthesis|nr:glycosyltransferase [Cyanobacteria bacterium GSL.Bin1]
MVKRLAYFVSHPIQYQAPLLRLIAADPEIDLEVFFFSDFSVQEYLDPGFGKAIKWDIPLTEGYKHHFLDTWGAKERHSWVKQPIAKNITKLLKEGNFDAVWVHGWFWVCSLQAILAANQLDIPVLLRGESNGLDEPTGGLKKIVKSALLKWLFDRVSAFLYVGTLNYQFYQRYGVNEERLFPMPYAVNNDYFQEKASIAHQNRETLRASLGLAKGRPIILFAAKLLPKKRPQDVLAAYRLLSADGRREPEPYLLFVGDGELRPQLEAEAKSTGWDSIRFLGFWNQSKIAEVYDLCDCFVLASDFEPWGLAINEVMNAGKVVIVSDAAGCAPDLVKHKENGWIFRVGDVEELAEGMKWAISHADWAGKESLERVKNWSFNEDIIGLKSCLAHLNS